MSGVFSAELVRGQFPALSAMWHGRPVVHCDGPAGSQVPQSVIDAVARCLREANANRGASFLTSRMADELIGEAHRAAADLVGSADPSTIVFGPNMTTLTYTVSRALSRTWRPGDEIVVSRLDHDANVTPWVQAARRAGASVRYVDVELEDCTLCWDSFSRALTDRTRLLAVGYASNAVGTINPVQRLVAAARSVGAVTYVDAVHFAPHALLDVQEVGCDFLVCSAYKFFGPHVGLLWGRRDLLESLEPEKLRPSPETVPERWMMGTQNHEGLAGVTAAVDYLAGIGRHLHPLVSRRREQLRAAFAALVPYEQELGQRLVRGLETIPGVRLWGITAGSRSHERVPTVSLTMAGRTPKDLAGRLAAEGLYTWAGNHYALPFTEAAGLEPHGTLRIGLLHYNTAEEVDRLVATLARLC